MLSTPVPVVPPFSKRALRTVDSQISWLMKKVIDDPQIISLAAGFVDNDCLPIAETQAAMERLFADRARARAALQYGASTGLKRLRDAQADRLRIQGLGPVTGEDVVITNGSQQFLHAITDVLVDPGDVVLVEDPTYFVMMDVLNSSGARVMGVDTDAEGIRPDSLARRFEDLKRLGLRDRLKMVYVMSYYQNPTGGNMSLARRRELYQVLTEEQAAGPWFYLLEDAAYRENLIDGEDEPFIKSFDAEGQSVILTGTFSKAFSPGYRLGWGILPEPLRKAFWRQKGNQDFGSSTLVQALLAEVMISGDFDVCSRRFRETYLHKRDALLQALREWWPADTELSAPQGGMYVWARIPGICTDPGSPFFNAALEAKVLYVPGAYCYCEETQSQRPDNAIRICYGVVEVEPMRKAIRLMGQVIDRLRGN